MTPAGTIAPIVFVLALSVGTPLSTAGASVSAHSVQGQCGGGVCVSAIRTFPHAYHRGSTALLQIRLTSATAVSGLNIDVELYKIGSKPTARVKQFVSTKVRLRASIPAGPNDYWMVPLTAQPGLYTVKIGVFNASWAHMYFWDNNAATIAIAD